MKRSDDFSVIRRFKSLNGFAQLFLCITLFLGINYLASVFFVREDITLNHQYSLSPETLAYLDNLTQPVHVILTIPPESEQPETAQIYKTVKNLVLEYVYNTRFRKVGKITAEFINPYRESQRAQALARKYGVHKDNAILIVSGDHYREISGNDLYTFNHGQIEGFRGEQIFTSAILDLARDQKQKVYFVYGHGEMRTDDVDPQRGLSQLAQILEKQNFQVKNIVLSHVEEIPKDADLLLIASPKTAFLSHEVQALKKYLNENNGRMLVFLEPAINHGLDDLFFDWGVLVDDLVVVDPGKDFQAAAGDLIITQLADHPITQFHVEYQLPVVMGLTRPVRPDIGADLDAKRNTFVLASSSEYSWGERDYKELDRAAFDELRDLPGPIPVAIVSERQVSSHLGIKISGGRLVVFGNDDFIGNNRINVLGNKILVQNAINWSLDRNEFLNIPVKIFNKYQITMSKSQLMQMSFAMLCIPAALALLGCFIFTIRRR